METWKFYKTAIWPLAGIFLVGVYFLFHWLEPRDKNVQFPSGYLSQNKTSLLFEGDPDFRKSEFFYDLVIEDLVEFVVIRNTWQKWSSSDPVVGPKFFKMTKASGPTNCAKPGQSSIPGLWLVSRRPYDALRGKCVLVKPVAQGHASLKLVEYDDFWFVEARSTGKQIASAPKSYRHKEVRALFGKRAGISIRPESPVYMDTFTDDELVRAIETGGYVTTAALTVITRRARTSDIGLAPSILVREAVSPNVVDAMLKLASARKDINHRILPGFLPLIPGVSPETAGRIFPVVIETLYTPFKASNPHGPWIYGQRWKKQIHKMRPHLEKEFAGNNHVPSFASVVAIRSASALVLRLGQPYIDRFYDEFKTEILSRNLTNNSPSFSTAILAQAEPDIVSVISKIRSQKPSPARLATIWALIQLSPNLPSEFIEELSVGCHGDPDFLNDPLASKKYLDGKKFCTYFFERLGSGLRL